MMRLKSRVADTMSPAAKIADTTAAPCTPVWASDASVLAFKPPMPTTGMLTAAHISRSVRRDTSAASGLVAVLNNAPTPK